MKNIVMARIDDRLIHGQVVTAWVKCVRADGILIIDDELAHNDLMKRIYRAAAPSGIRLYIRNEQSAVSFIKNQEHDFSDKEDLIILVKTPNVLENLINRGISLEKIILGGMGSNAERRQLVRNVHASDEEREVMKRLIDRDVEMVFQLVPDDKPVQLKDLL